MFTYTVFDEFRGEQTVTVTLNVTPVPDVPDAVNDEYDVELGATAVPLNVLANDVNFDARSPYFYPHWTDIDLADDVLEAPSILRLASTEIRGSTC